MRYELTFELLDDVRRLDAQINDSHRRIRLAVKASGTSVTDIYGIGPIHAGTIIGYSGDIRRFANRDAYASYNGTAPIERSSGGRVVHRFRFGAIASSTTPTPSTWLPSPRSVILEQRDASISSARSPRARPRKRLSARSSARSATPSTASSSSTRNRGPGGHYGTTRCLRDRLFTLRDRFFGEVTPEPIETLRRRALKRRLDSSRLEVPELGS